MMVRNVIVFLLVQSLESEFDTVRHVATDHASFPRIKEGI
jgi:hypothetical protein